jgi:hypothetical protein
VLYEWKWQNPELLTAYELLKQNHYDIVLIEDYPCENKDQLHSRERFHIEMNENCVNKVIPTRTDEEYQKTVGRVKNLEWSQTHKEEKRIMDKTYRENNKQKLSDKAKQYYEANKNAIIDKSRCYYETNKDKINENVRNKKYTCCCGKTLRMNGKSEHERTKMHLDVIREQRNSKTILIP